MKNMQRGFTGRRPLRLVAWLLLPVLTAAAAPAEIVIANIASRGFDVLARTDAPVTRLEIFLDAAGLTPATGLQVERQPLVSGATEGDAYARRSADRLTRAAMTAAGNNLFRVANAEPATVYHFRVILDDKAWPESGLMDVLTPPTGAWRNEARQILVDLGRPGEGWVGVLSVALAHSPLLSVCGDGAPTNSVLVFNLTDWTDDEGNPLLPAPGDPMTLRLFGQAGTPATERVLSYVPPPGDASVAALGEALAPLARLVVASAIAGLSQPPEGESFHFLDNVLECRLVQTEVTDVDTQYVAFGWSGSGSVPLSGRNTAFSFQLTADSSLAWRWRTNLWIEVVADHGSVDLSSGWYRFGTLLSAAVTPDAEWTFREWTGLLADAAPETAFTVETPGMLRAEFDPVLVPGGEGMPEWWLTLAGLTGADRDPGADPDRDGMTNLQEWIADTHPDDPQSTFRILSVASTNGQVSLTWRGGREARQTVEMLEGSLAEGAWQPVAVRLPPTDIIGTLTLELEDQVPRFFRLRAERD